MNKNKSQKQIRENNAKKVLQLLIKGKAFTRKEIAEESKVSPSTVTQIITPMIEEGIVVETKEGESTGGRKPVFIQFAKDYGEIAIVDISDMGTNLYFFDLMGNQLSSEYLSQGKLKMQRLFEKIVNGIKKNNSADNPIIAIGLVVQDGLYPSTDIIMVELGTNLVPMSLESAISTNLKIKTSKISTKNFSLEYYIDKEKRKNDNYCFISITNKVTMTLVVGGEKVEIAGKRSFNITELINDSAFYDKLYTVLEKKGGVHTTEHKFEIEDQGDKLLIGLAQMINNVHILFSINDVLLLGDDDKLNNELLEMLDKILPNEISIRRVQGESRVSLRLYVQSLVEKLIPYFIERAHI